MTKFKGFILSIEDVVRLISKRMCLVCKCNLDRDFKRKDWHIPLCKKHRMEFLEEDSASFLGGIKNK